MSLWWNWNMMWHLGLILIRNYSSFSNCLTNWPFPHQVMQHVCPACILFLRFSLAVSMLRIPTGCTKKGLWSLALLSCMIVAKWVSLAWPLNWWAAREHLLVKALWMWCGGCNKAFDDKMRQWAEPVWGVKEKSVGGLGFFGFGCGAGSGSGWWATHWGHRWQEISVRKDRVKMVLLVYSKFVELEE